MNRLTFLAAIPRDAKILVFINALRSFSSAILSVNFSIYLSKLGASAVAIGLTFTGVSLFSAFRGLLEGFIADRIGRKPLLLYAASSMVASGTLLALSDNISILILAAIVFSIGGNIGYTPAVQAILSEKVVSEDRTKAFSINAFFGSVSSIFGSFAGGLPEAFKATGLSEIASYKQTFTLLVVTGAVSFFLYLIIKETIARRDLDNQNNEFEEEDRDERMMLIKWSGVVALDEIGGSFNNLISYWYYLTFGVGPTQIGALSGVSQFLTLFSYFLGFRMAKRFGTIPATALSRVPVVVINILTPLLPNFMAVSIVRVLMSLFSMIDVPLRQSYLMGVLKSRKRASALGLVAVVGRVTSAGAPSLSGYFYQHVSMTLPFFCAASFQFASAGLMWLLFKDIKPPEER